MSYKIIPKNNNVVVIQKEESDKMFGNIFIPDTGKENSLIGEVVAVGPGMFSVTGVFMPTTTQIGEIINYPSFGGQRMTVDNIDYIIIKEPDILTELKTDINE